MKWKILIKCSMGLCQGEELLMLFALRRLDGKFRIKNKELLFIFIDLEKAFDQVPREAIVLL